MAFKLGCVALVAGLALIPAYWEHFHSAAIQFEGRAVMESVADNADDQLASIDGIQVWVRILSLSDGDDLVRRASTLFVPSDGALRALPTAMLDAFLDPDRGEQRRAFLARSATDVRIALEEIPGKRIHVSTLDGRPLVIDATGGDIRVGNAEAIGLRTLPDGRSLFILDDLVTDGSVDPE